MPLHLASVGSSFASGPGIPPVANKHAGRSAVNYGALLAEHIGAAKFTDLTVAGATLLNLTSDPQIVEGDPGDANDDPGHTFPPQLTQLPADADIVLVLGGGNDLGYIGNFFVDAARELPYLRTAMGLPANSTPDDVPDLPPPQDHRFLTDPLQALAGRYAEILDAIHAAAPGAHVLVVEYLAMLGPETRPGIDVPFSPAQMSRHQERARVLEQATRLALSEGGEARDQWCSLVPVTELSRARHAIGSPEPWVSAISPELVETMGAFHPNAQGMVAVEKLVYQKLVELGKI
ncbi:SGNH hydrolase-type esterase domain-containing protein [Microdochium trichocladiopsis]|uniref:SGNH hydrolase-type esterase domain-containing protein n=1 Tax=Microdochium trichocladiopsis TaxID=1682393 RepID=A0A9P8Y9K9_9PEZI|nr:SGNH hydrolase-type esterase domain-containing protein [Microdochium trichocladiopsis]KAH7035554.1 SGNH hydrolase-type esterase domain-containing protein [Microdochium trichocladiopsis]